MKQLTEELTIKQQTLEKLRANVENERDALKELSCQLCVEREELR